jgi:hypothetical protein
MKFEIEGKFGESLKVRYNENGRVYISKEGNGKLLAVLDINSNISKKSTIRQKIKQKAL